jgi:Rieske Fe-S protein
LLFAHFSGFFANHRGIFSLSDTTARDLQAKGPGGRALVQGLKGDATYLIVTDDNKMENFGVNAVCTHLGCVVPWNKAANKFMCPCHGTPLP